MLLLQGYSNNVACQLLLWNRWCYLPSPWNCPKNIPKGHTGSHWMGLKHLRASNIYIKKKKIYVLIWEKLKADISLWSCWRQTWLNGDGFEHRLFFLFLYDLGPFSSYAHGPICPTWFTKYGTKEWCLFQIWELTVKQKKNAKLMWVCKDVIWLICVLTLDVTEVLVSLHLKLGSEWLGTPNAGNTGIQQLWDVRTKRQNN